VTTYLDSSVVLRIVLGARKALSKWRALEQVVSSALVEVECLRTLDRLRLVDNIAAEVIAIRRQAIYDFVSRTDIVEVTAPVLARAAQPLPVPLRTLDSIHLATAMLWREAEHDEIEIATHDEALALAARAMGFRVIGV
jgi:predicted nucleic acid-binding protein